MNVLTFHAGPDAIRKAYPDARVKSYVGKPFAGQYASEGSGVVPVLSTVFPGEKVWLVGFSEGCQAVRALLRNPANRPRIAGVIAADGIHLGAPLSPTNAPAYAEPWQWATREALAGRIGFAWTCSSIPTVAPVVRTRDAARAILQAAPDLADLAPPPAGPYLAKRARFFQQVTTGTDAAEHVKHGRALPELLATVAPTSDGAGVVAALTALGAFFAKGWPAL